MARNPLMPLRSGGFPAWGIDPLISLHREMNRLFDDVMGGMPSAGRGQGGLGQMINTQMNVSETESEIRVSAVPLGVGEKDIDVSLNDGVLTIRGETRFERKDEKESFHFVERSLGTFQRSLRLHFPVDPEKVRADFDNGVLNVTLPKSAQPELSWRIQVQRRRAGATQIGQPGGQGLQDQQSQGGQAESRQAAEGKS